MLDAVRRLVGSLWRRGVLANGSAPCTDPTRSPLAIPAQDTPPRGRLILIPHSVGFYDVHGNALRYAGGEARKAHRHPWWARSSPDVVGE